MKLFFKQRILKCISIFLIITIIIGLIQHINIIDSNAYDTSNYDGIYKSALIDKQRVIKCDVIGLTNDVTEITSYKEDGTKCVSKISSDYVIKYYYDKFNNMIYTEDIEFKEFENYDSDTSRGIPIRVYELYNRKHWYERWTSVNNLLIGCDWEYLIHLGSLSESEQANVNEYIDAIKSSNTSIITGIAAIALLVIASKGTLTGIIASVLEAKQAGMAVTAIADMLLAKYSSIITTKKIATSIVNAILDVIGVNAFFANRAKLKTYYKMIREYGIAKPKKQKERY